MVSSVEMWQDPQVLEAQARPHHRDDLEFHNWPHALDVRDDTRANANRCVDNGITVDWDVLDPASLNHDDDFWLVPRGTPGMKSDHRFTTKERHAAAVARQELTDLGMPPSKVKHVSDNILSSEKGVRCKTIEARCLRQADLANVASPNPLIFLNSTYRLYREDKQLKGEQPMQPSLKVPFVRDFIGFAAVSYEVLTTYNSEDISLGDFDRDREGQSLFGQRAARNIALLVPNRLTDFLSRHLADIIDCRPIGI